MVGDLQDPKVLRNWPVLAVLSCPPTPPAARPHMNNRATDTTDADRARIDAFVTADPTQGRPVCAGNLVSSHAPLAQGIEHRPPEAGAQVRILPGAQRRRPLTWNNRSAAFRTCNKRATRRRDASRAEFRSLATPTNGKVPCAGRCAPLGTRGVGIATGVDPVWWTSVKRLGLPLW